METVRLRDRLPETAADADFAAVQTGVIRDMTFHIPIQASILSERRVNQPYGLKGGEGGQRGRNLWIKQRRKEDGDWKENDSTPR